MDKYPTSTLIISTYNWPQALRPVLASVRRQRVLPDEVIVADDGSSIETRDLIRELKPSFPVPLLHVWQEDKGFRPSKIRNKAIGRAVGEYIVQIDGDVLLHPRFVADHLRFSRPNAFLVGSRVLLSKRATRLQKKKEAVHIHPWTPFIKNRVNAIYMPLLTNLLRDSTRDVHSSIESIRGCNMSFWRKDFMAVNGYNEAFVGWGREDSELGIRLINLGLEKDRLKFSALQYHLHHKERTREHLPANNQILEKTIRDNITYCTEGVATHMKQPMEVMG